MTAPPAEVSEPARRTTSAPLAVARATTSAPATSATGPVTTAEPEAEEIATVPPSETAEVVTVGGEPEEYATVAPTGASEAAGTTSVLPAEVSEPARRTTSAPLVV